MSGLVGEFGEAELKKFRESAEAAAREAGSMIADARKSRPGEGVHVKSGVDLVTDTDVKAEKAIMGRLRKEYPSHSFMGEEGTAEGGDAELTVEPTWVIDPLDGTTNFVHGFPFVCVSIALVVDRIPVVGVVFNPFLGEMFTACKGCGAFLNGTRIGVRSGARLGDALIVNNIGAARDAHFIRQTLGRLAQLLEENTQALRMSGSAAQNMCYVGSGQLDCYFEDGYGGPWDVAAGVVIVQEAGGVCTTLDERPFQLLPGKGKIVCGGAPIVADVCGAIARADAKLGES